MKKIVVPSIILIIVLVLGGGWNYLNTLKTSLKPDYAKQISSLATLRTKIDQATILYQDDSENKTGSKTNVLGASTSKDPRSVISGQIGQVLGIEDNQSMKRSRDIVEIFSQSMEEIKKISDTNTSISHTTGLALLKSSFGVKAPIEETAKFVTDINPILDLLKKEQDLSISAYSTGYDLGATLQLALIRADEESIKKLEVKINDLQKLVDEEKTLNTAGLPTELKTILDKNLANEDKMVSTFKGIPDIIRKKDIVALQKVVQSLVVDVSGDGVKTTTDLISFLRNNTTMRSVDTIKDKWSDASKSL